MSRAARSGIALLGLGLTLGLGACFIESAKPSTFRYECTSTDDCVAGEVCANDLCQVPCGAGEEACAQGLVCLNGFCSSLCPTDQDVCPAPQECVSLTADPAEEVADEVAGTGVCTVLCDDTDSPCPKGQLCLAGFCAVTCATVDDCGSGEDCTEVGPGFSVCTPSSSSGGSFP